MTLRRSVRPERRLPRIPPIVDYGAFSTMSSQEDMDEAEREFQRKVDTGITDLRNHWYELLTVRPLSVEELVKSVPEGLEFVMHHLPVAPQAAVAKVFEGRTDVTFRYGAEIRGRWGRERAFYYGLSDTVRSTGT